MDKGSEKIYVDFRNHLVESRHKSYEQFDKAIFLLSGGGLTISLAILKNLVPFQAAESKPLLAASWILFFNSININASIIHFQPKSYR